MFFHLPDGSNVGRSNTTTMIPKTVKMTQMRMLREIIFTVQQGKCVLSSKLPDCCNLIGPAAD